MIEKLIIAADKYLCQVEASFGVPHMLVTLDLIQFIAKNENFNIFRASASAILHDIGLYNNKHMENDTVDNNHGIDSSRLAAKILQDYGFSKIEIDDISTAIASHCFPGYQKTPLAKLLWDADKLNVFIPEMQTVYLGSMGKKGLSKELAIQKIEQAKNYYFDNFYTQNARNIAKNNIAVNLNYFSEFYNS